jgi:hypothetical protein
MQRTPAVRGQLDDREQDHGGGDIEIDQQHAQQHHAARHAKHAGNERRNDDGGADQRERGGGHKRFRLSLIFSENGFPLFGIMPYAERASAPSIISTALRSP